MNVNLLNKLKDSKLKKELLVIYSDPENKRHFSGIVESIINDFVLLKYIDDKGIIDGYNISKIDNIYELSTNCKYARRLIKLFKKIIII